MKQGFTISSKKKTNIFADTSNIILSFLFYFVEKEIH